jgi:hypothetical protein
MGDVAEEYSSSLNATHAGNLFFPQFSLIPHANIKPVPAFPYLWGRRYSKVQSYK